MVDNKLHLGLTNRLSILYLWLANAAAKNLSCFHVNTTPENSFSLALAKHL